MVHLTIRGLDGEEIMEMLLVAWRPVHQIARFYKEDSFSDFLRSVSWCPKVHIFIALSEAFFKANYLAEHMNSVRR